MSNRRAMIFTLGGWDADALAFISAAGLTDGTQKSAINNYVKDLKSHGLWTLIVALYPFIGGTASSHLYNIKDPRNLDVAFRMLFNGSVTHDANGFTTDGSTGYGNLRLTPSVHLTLNNESLFLYSRTSAASVDTNGTDLGAAVSTTQRDSLQVRTSADISSSSLNSTTSGAGLVSTANTNGQGLYMASRISSTDFRLYKNGSQIGSTSTSTNNGTRANIQPYLGGRNVSNALSNPVARNYAMAGVGKGFDSTQAADFYTLTQAFQTTLGRQV